MTTARERSSCLICTFYSYKGGVGRSMALANIAVLLAQWGSKVLVVDWDLEAPGIERYFEEVSPGCQEKVKQQRGIVDIADDLAKGIECDWSAGIVSLPLLGANGHIDLLSAGRRDARYVERLQRLDWDSLFQDHDFGRRLEAVRSNWQETYDYVLIDSRTGITDIGGICTIYLPDILVALFTANYQSVEGVAEVVSRARRARSNLPVDRGSLVCIPVPARDESRTEYEQSVKWRRIYRELLMQFYTDFLPRNVGSGDALELLRIPNVPFWSFGERLPVLTESAGDPSTITYYYTILARLIATDLSWQDSTSVLFVSSAGSDDIRRRVFVIHGRDNALATRFYDLLRAVDLRPLEWDNLIEAAGGAALSLTDVVARAPGLAQATLVLLSPDNTVELDADPALADDIPLERAPARQARPNVLFELGLVQMAYPGRTVIVEVGNVPPLSDLAGLNVIRFDGSVQAIRKVLSRLEVAGCAVDYSGTDWMDSGRFTGLRAFGGP